MWAERVLASPALQTASTLAMRWRLDPAACWRYGRASRKLAWHILQESLAIQQKLEDNAMAGAADAHGERDGVDQHGQG